MYRLKQIPKNNRLAGRRILVTGCGYKPLRHIFTDIVDGTPSHDEIILDEKPYKINIGAATAGVLARHGAVVHMVSSSEDKLQALVEKFTEVCDPSLLEYSVVDVTNEDALCTFVGKLPRDLPMDWVQSVGLGAGSYQVANDNPYLPLEEIPNALLENEVNMVTLTTHSLIKALLPRFRQQQKTKIAVITSMSAVRSYSYGGSHCTAKAAIDRYVNTAMLATYKDHIFVSSIRPGGIDSGFYDSQIVRQAVRHIIEEYNGPNEIYLAPPTAVGEAIAMVFTAPAHIVSLNLVAKGQAPHEGS